MAPEIMRKGKFTKKSDVFSFGVMLYQLLCSSLPQQSDRNGRPSGRILDSEWDTIPVAWRNAVRAMTEPDLEHRLADFDAVIGMLKRIDAIEEDGRELIPSSRLPQLPPRESISFLDGVATGTTTADMPVDEGDENHTVFIDDL